MMKKFDKAFAAGYITGLCIKYDIKIIGYSASSCGRAWWKTRSIKIPMPTNIDRLGVCLHEIKHIIDGTKGATYEREFLCDMYALDKLRDLGYDTTEWEKRMRWHSLMQIAKAVNRKLNIDNISQEIRDFFCEINFNEWKGKRVFVSHDKTSILGYRVTMMANYSFDEVEMLLGRQGLVIDKSKTDDSTYGKWMVSSNNERYGHDFDNLSEIIQHYNLTL